MFRYLSENFQLLSIIDVTPFHVMSVTKFEHFLTVLCSAKIKIRGTFKYHYHIRIYENIRPFNLLFAINLKKLDRPNMMVWNEKAMSLFFLSHDDHGVWQIKWTDHLVREFPCPLKVRTYSLSFTNDGNVLIFGLFDKLIYVCNTNGALIRTVSSVHDIHYKLYAPISEYWSFRFLHYDPRVLDRYGSEVFLHLKDWNDLNAESSLDVNSTNEFNIASSDIERFSFFFMGRSPGKCEDFDLFKLTIERTSKSPKHLAEGYSASDEGLLSEFLSNSEGRFSYSSGKGCNVPSYMWVDASYHYDSENYQLIVGLSSDFMKDKVYMYIVQCVP